VNALKKIYFAYTTCFIRWISLPASFLPTVLTICLQLFPFVTGSGILLYFIAMVCVALTSYQCISQLCHLNYCQNDWSMVLLQALEKLITWTETFFSFYVVSLPDGWHYFEQSSLFSFEIIWSGSDFYFVFLESTSWICILSEFAFWCPWSYSNLHSMMILLHQWVNYNFKWSWKHFSNN